ncbi:hypothetical protein [Acetobacter lambici]|uniref:hypothetical protein n=1 Tax=Acetobacter lambici TaxID=1332824 RepID=UPI0020A2B939|nr:hypothetical protein [Acetobacter lambici]MCP1241647.1 hypothetical protein [Acetobacter lambici]
MAQATPLPCTMKTDLRGAVQALFFVLWRTKIQIQKKNQRHKPNTSSKAQNNRGCIEQYFLRFCQVLIPLLHFAILY